MKNAKWFFIPLTAAALAAGGWYLYWQHDQPRRVALQYISQLAAAVANPHGAELFNLVLIPVAVQAETPAEQQEFLSKVLAGEISPAGVRAMQQHADYGPAKNVFPEESAGWCQRSGVDPNDCVAFKMERAGIRAEVLLVRTGDGYRVVRCNHVKQMAGDI